MIMTLKRSQPDKANPAQLTFSPLRFKHSRSLVTVAEVADALGIGDQHVRDLVECRELGAAPINQSTERQHVRILRYTVDAWFLEQWFDQHGTEYPFNNSEEITFWRQHLRDKRAADARTQEANQ